MPSAATETPSTMRALERTYAEAAVPTRSGRSIPIFPIGLTEQPGRALAQLVADHAAAAAGPAYHTIETGFGLGLSGLAIAAGTDLAAQRTARPIDHHHTAIDPGQRNPASLDAVGIELFKRADLTQRLTLIEQPSELALPAMLAGPARFDLAFIDGAHWFENALIDIVMLTRLLRPGGLLIIDDQWMGGVRAATDYARRNLSLQTIPCGLTGAERFAIFRTLAPDPARAWDHWVPFECGEHQRGR